MSLLYLKRDPRMTQVTIDHYRPVSLTSDVCKLFESIICDSVVEHLSINMLLNNSQHGFRQHRSCLTNILEFFEHITDLIVDQGLPVDVIYLDLQKAFDKVPHRRLLSLDKGVAVQQIAEVSYKWKEFRLDTN